MIESKKSKSSLHGDDAFVRSWIGRCGMTLALLVMMSCNAGQAPQFPAESDATPAEDSIGERLFLDTRLT